MKTQTLESAEKQMLLTLAAPAVHALIEQGQRHDETVQFFLEKLGAAQELAKRWRTDFPDSEIAKKCATDLEAIVASPEDRGKRPTSN